MPNVENRTKNIIVLPGVVQIPGDDEPSVSSTVDSSCVVIKPDEIKPVPDAAWEVLEKRKHIKALLSKRKLLVVGGGISKVEAEPDDEARELLEMERDEFVADWPKLGMSKCKKFIAKTDDVVLLSLLHTDEQRDAVHKLLEDRIGVLTDEGSRANAG